MNAAAASPRLLVVDDEPDLRTLYELTLLREGYDVDSTGSVEEAWSLLRERGDSAYQLVITDMRLPDGTGLDLLRRIDGAGRHERAIVITAYGSPENAVEALKAGAYDYLTKPVDLRQFRAAVASALGRLAPRAAAGLAASAAAAPARGAAIAADAADAARPGASALARIVGTSAAMQQVRGLVDKVARSMAPVLVHGESGTGKELVARAIHDCSPRQGAPFVAVNCGAIPEALLEAEFFGHRKGAYTGAHEDREGFFQAAQGGTLFLDEIGDLPLSMQAKLLRVIQERAVRPLGAVAELPTNVRILSATHRDLGAEVSAGRFRQDLYYRLNVIRIPVPPLRERIDDLPLICRHVLARIARDAGVEPVPRLTGGALQALLQHPFPGNVRELENLLHRALALAGGPELDDGDLGLVATDAHGAGEDASATAAGRATPAGATGAPGAAGRIADAGEGAAGHRSRDAPSFGAARADTATPGPAALLPAPTPAADPPSTAALPPPEAALPSDLERYLDRVERDILERALDRFRFNRTAAGASLGLSLRQMRYRMARLGIGSADGDRGDAG